MRVGIAIEETWGFFREIHDELKEHHEIHRFERRRLELPFFRQRADRYLFRRDLRAFLRASDVAFFEWASHLLEAATHLPKSCGIVTRLHRYELYEWVDKINWERVDRVILVSQAKRREFISRFPEQAEKAIVIHVAVDVNKFTCKPRSFRGNLGILCHLTPRKRVYDLLLTFYELCKRHDHLSLHIGGGSHPLHGDYAYAIEDTVKRLGLQNRVALYGHVENTKEWYQDIDIFISNSYSEGLQVAPLEAMASGCFCLSHHWAGAEELLPEENLYFSSAELQEKIIAYCEAPESERQRRRGQMRSIVCDRFAIDQTKARVRDLIEDVGAQWRHRRNPGGSL